MTQLTVPRLLAELVDDAGLFPPTQLSMTAAVERHRGDRRRESPILTHRFLCPASRLGELRAALTEGDDLTVGVIGDTGVAGVPVVVAEVLADARLTLSSIDVAVADARAVVDAIGTLTGLPAGVSAWVEPARGPGWLDAVGALRGSTVGAKLRCGGASAAAFPTVDEVAAFIRRCVGDGVRFKATAGLHRAVRGVDEDDGVVHHGYLNLLVATARAVAGDAAAEVAAAVACTDAAALTAQARALPDDAAARARDAFVCYGSCSTAEPLAAAIALGLVA